MQSLITTYLGVLIVSCHLAYVVCEEVKEQGCPTRIPFFDPLEWAMQNIPGLKMMVIRVFSAVNLSQNAFDIMSTAGLASVLAEYLTFGYIVITFPIWVFKVIMKNLLVIFVVFTCSLLAVMYLNEKS